MFNSAISACHLELQLLAIFDKMLCLIVQYQHVTYNWTETYLHYPGIVTEYIWKQLDVDIFWLKE
jgi:hypothetical protein